MALRGSAFLALWNDFDPSRDDEYNCWHTYEHVPERVGIEGILAGRRYAAMERDDHRYFTLYDLASLAALEGPQYADVVAQPTTWSASMRPSFRNFLRRPCALASSAGVGMGASVATFRFAAQSPMKRAAWHQMLQRQLTESGITALHLGDVDVDAKFPLDNTVPAETIGGTPCVLLVEAIDREVLTARCPAIAGVIAAAAACAREPEWETYDLAVVVTESDLAEAKGRRQPGRADLQRRWQP